MLLGLEHLKSTLVLQYNSKNIVSFLPVRVNHKTVRFFKNKLNIKPTKTTKPFISIKLNKKGIRKNSSTRSGPLGKGLEVNHLNKEQAHSNKRSTKPDFGRKSGFFQAQILGNTKQRVLEFAAITKNLFVARSICKGYKDSV